MPDASTTAAPAGFTLATWADFARDGILIVEDALDAAQVDALKAAIDAQKDPTAMNVVEADPRLAAMIDHPAHVGFVHDIYGDMLKLLRSEYFKREPRQAIRNKWHFDGPRVLPFEVFSQALPLRIKVGYWLTPLPREDMGNLVYVPGSHRRPYLDSYHTHEAHPEERQLVVRPGALTLMWGGLWHRVAENRSDLTRLNMFLEYGPSWVVTSDRVRSDPDWVETLTRNQRIILRDYDHPNNHVKIHDQDVPLFHRREDEPDVQEGVYGDHVPPALRKRSTWAERNGLA